jgi:eukaryotic-like serine/threonine-protein kinase
MNDEIMRDERLDEIKAAYLEAEDAGWQPPQEKFLECYPEHATELEDFFDIHASLRFLSCGRTSTPAEGLVGQMFGNFKLLDVIGRGGMGTVYQAEEVPLKRFVALKVIRDEYLSTPHDRRRFREEAQKGATLRHPHIIKIYTSGEYNGCPYFTMELVESTLAKRRDWFSQDHSAVAKLMQEVAEAVQYAHDVGILHRDLKPSNILIGDNNKPLVTDFGLAEWMRSIGGSSEGIVGTDGYMAPEQLTNPRNLTNVADVYSLGVILHELLTRRRPMRMEGDNPIPPRSINRDVSRDLDAICAKCLQKDPGRRYARAGDLAEDLRRFLEGAEVRARPISTWERATRWMMRKPVVTSLVGGMMVLILVTVGLRVKTLTLQRELLTQQRDYAIEKEGIASELLAKAKRERDRADRHFERALRATRLMLVRVARDELKDVPQMEQVRRDLLEKAVQFYTELVEAEPNDQRLGLEIGQAWIAAGDLYRLMGELEKAVDADRRAIHLLGKLANEHPEEPDYTAELAAAYQNLALAQHQGKKIKDAESNYTRSLGLLMTLFAAHPERPVYLRYLAHTRGNLAALYQMTGQRNQSIALNHQVVGELERLIGLESLPSQQRQDRQRLAKALDNLGGLYASDDQMDPEARASKAEISLNRAMVIREKLVEAERNSVAYQQDLARSWHNLAFLYLNYRRTPEGLALAKERLDGSIRINKDLSVKFRKLPEYRCALVEDYSTLGDVYTVGNQPDRAEDSFHLAVTIADELASDYSLNDAYRDLLLEVVGQLVGWSRAHDHDARTRQFLTPILETWQKRLADNPKDSLLKAALLNIQKQLR